MKRAWAGCQFPQFAPDEGKYFLLTSPFIEPIGGNSFFLSGLFIVRQYAPGETRVCTIGVFKIPIQEPN
jgi:hypothetical protein